ncbi:hypothetical protein [Lysobacter gummosus]|uniref:hypothetical protein n=1 Tax=Lysobacter gummosus TaxID=262324 RepID=UPI00364205B4
MIGLRARPRGCGRARDVSDLSGLGVCANAPLYFGDIEHPVRFVRERLKSTRAHFTSTKPNIQEPQRHPSRTSFPRTRESRDFKRSRTKGTGCSAPPK